MVEAIEAFSSVALIGLPALFFVSRLTGRRYWDRFWYRLFRLYGWFDRMHPGMRMLMIALTFGLTFPIAAFSGGASSTLWLVTLIYTIWRGLKQRVRGLIRRRRYAKYLKNGFALPIEIASYGGGYGWLDKFSWVIGLPMRSVVAIGASGAGKTEVVKHFVRRMLADDSAMMFVFDRKTSFQDFFDDINVDYIRISLHDSTIVPNFFQEFENEDDVDEFARSLFPKSEDDDFFNTSSQHVFAAVIKSMIRNNGGVEGLSNANIRQYFEESTAQDVYDDLMEHDDFRGVATAIDAETAGKQATGVYASVQNTVQEMFRGDFARDAATQPRIQGYKDIEREGFSIREYRENPCGVPVVFDLPTEHTEAVKPIFRFLLDHSAMHGMAATERQSNFVLDEFAQIPHLRRLEEVVNVGREENVSTVVCLQSVKQLFANYGNDYGGSILAGLTSKILLRPNDEETVDYIRESVGTEFREYTRTSMDMFGREVTETKSEEEHIFSRGEIRKWDTGVGVVASEKGWVFGHILMLATYGRGHMHREARLTRARMNDMDFVFIDRDEIEDDEKYQADWVTESDDDGGADWEDGSGTGVADD